MKVVLIGFAVMVGWLAAGMLVALVVGSRLDREEDAGRPWLVAVPDLPDTPDVGAERALEPVAAGAAAVLAAAPTPRPPRRRRRVALPAAMGATMFLGSTGLAAAGALPDPIQGVAHSVLGTIGVPVPVPPGPAAGSLVAAPHSSTTVGRTATATADDGRARTEAARDRRKTTPTTARAQRALSSAVTTVASVEPTDGAEPAPGGTADPSTPRPRTSDTLPRRKAGEVSSPETPPAPTPEPPSRPPTPVTEPEKPEKPEKPETELPPTTLPPPPPTTVPEPEEPTTPDTRQPPAPDAPGKDPVGAG